MIEASNESEMMDRVEALMRLSRERDEMTQECLKSRDEGGGANY